MNEGKAGFKQTRHTSTTTPAQRNPVAKNAMATVGGGGFGKHKDRKRAAKHGETKHKKSQPDLVETQLNELDLYAPNTMYIRLEDGSYVKAEYRLTQKLSGQINVDDDVSFAKFSSVDPKVADKLGLDNKLDSAQPVGGRSNPEPTVISPGGPIQGGLPISARRIQVMDLGNYNQDSVPQELITKLDLWIGQQTKAEIAMNEAAKKGLYYYVNKRKKAGTSRSASHPDAPSEQDWKDAAKTAKKESIDKRQGVAEGSEYTEPKLGTIKANLMNTTEPTVQVQVFKHNTLRGDNYWVTKEVKKFKTMDQAQAYIDRINKQGVAEGYNLDSHIKQTRDRILKYKDWNTTGSHDKRIKELQDKLKELLAQKKQGVAEGTESQYIAARYIDEFGDGNHWYVKGTPEVIKKFVLLANSLEDETVKGTEYEPGKGMMGGIHAQLGNDAAPQWTTVPARNLEGIKPIGDKVLQRLMRPNLADGAQEFMSELLWAMEAQGLALVHDDSQQGVAEGWPDYDDNQYSLTDSTGKELTLLRGNTPEEAIERAKQLIGSNEKLLATFGLVKLTPRPHYIVRNAKRQGVAEGKIKGADGKACWKGKRYAGTKNGKDICVDVSESVMGLLPPESDHEATMALSELYRNAKYGMALLKIIEADDAIDGWVQANLTNAAAMLDKVFHYLDYKKMHGRKPTMEQIDDDNIDDADAGEADGAQAIENLLLIVEYSIKLMEMIQPGDNLASWVSMKLTKASEAVSSAKHFIEYRQFEKHTGDMFESRLYQKYVQALTNRD